MAKYRLVKTKFWDDDYIYDLNAHEKLLFLFLLTNERTSLCGIYNVSIGYIYRMTNIPKDIIEKCLKKFEADGRIKYFDGWVSIKNFVKHQTASPKITEGIKRELSEIPQAVAKTAYPIHRVGINLNFNLNSNLNFNSNSNAKTARKNSCEFCQKTKGHESWCQLSKNI